MRLSRVVMAYFVMGAVMWGGGVLAWDDAGVGQLLISDAGTDAEVNQQTSEDLSQLGGPIQTALSTVESAGLVAIWNILVKLVGYLNWPLVAMFAVDAPPRILVIGGGTPTMAFWVSFIRLVRTSG
jgi:hypothetical protein